MANSRKATGKNILIPEYGNYTNPGVRAKYGYLEAAVSIVGNLFLFLLKLLLGLFINSIALIADAVHTLSDVGTSFIVILGFKMAKKPADKEHPHGHGRIEYIATLIIAVLLMITGITFIEQSIERIWKGVEIANEEYALVIGIVVIVSAIAKELMAQYSNAIGKKISSDMLIADGWHHRSDAIATVLVGVSIIVTRYFFSWLDPIFGIAVSGIVIYVGVDLIRKASNSLMGCAPSKEELRSIKKMARNKKGIKGVHDVQLHDYGMERVISLHAEVDSNITVERAHEMIDGFEKQICTELNCKAIIHMDPRSNNKS